MEDSSENEEERKSDTLKDIWKHLGYLEMIHGNYYYFRLT